MGKLRPWSQGVVVTETGAIITGWPTPSGGGLAHGRDPARGAFLRWMFLRRRASIRRSSTACSRGGARAHGPLGYGSYERVLDTIEQALKPGPWLLGERFSGRPLYLVADRLRIVTKTLEPARRSSITSRAARRDRRTSASSRSRMRCWRS